MKKNYQVPETVICEMVISNSFLVEDSGEIGQDGNLTNETTFDEGELLSDTPSSIWDD